MKDDLVEALRAAEDALRDYACHGGEGIPCLRDCPGVGKDGCGKAAGDALIVVLAALTSTSEATGGEG